MKGPGAGFPNARGRCDAWAGLGGCIHCHVRPCLRAAAGKSMQIAAAQTCFLEFVWGPKRDQAANREGLCSQQKQALKAVAPGKQTQI